MRQIYVDRVLAGRDRIAVFVEDDIPGFIERPPDGITAPPWQAKGPLPV